MQLSESLLKDKEIGKMIFNNSIHKTKVLLKDIFGLDFENEDPSINLIAKDDDLYSFKVVFNLNEREIIAEFKFQHETKDMVKEVLKIYEDEINVIPFSVESEDFKIIKNKVMDILENQFEVNFTPLDPETEDKNIKYFKADDNKKNLECSFTVDNQEIEFIAKHNEEMNTAGGGRYIEIYKHKKHSIYLD